MGGRRRRRSVDDGYLQSTTACIQFADQDVNTDDCAVEWRCGRLQLVAVDECDTTTVIIFTMPMQHTVPGTHEAVRRA